MQILFQKSIRLRDSVVSSVSAQCSLQARANSSATPG